MDAQERRIFAMAKTVEWFNTHPDAPAWLDMVYPVDKMTTLWTDICSTIYDEIWRDMQIPYGREMEMRLSCLFQVLDAWQRKDDPEPPILPIDR